MRRLVLTVLTVAGLAGPVVAQLSPDWTRCVNEGIAFLPDVAISSCTAVINSGSEPRANLAIAYYNRSLAYQAKGEVDRVIADATEAIEINPRHAGAHTNRGNAYQAKREDDRAIAHYTKAIEIDPRYALAYTNRGRTYANKGDIDRAIAFPIGTQPAAAIGLRRTTQALRPAGEMVTDHQLVGG